MVDGKWRVQVEGQCSFFHPRSEIPILRELRVPESERNYTKVSVEIVGRQFRVSLKQMSPLNKITYKINNFRRVLTFSLLLQLLSLFGFNNTPCQGCTKPIPSPYQLPKIGAMAQGW